MWKDEGSSATTRLAGKVLQTQYVPAACDRFDQQIYLLGLRVGSSGGEMIQIDFIFYVKLSDKDPYHMRKRY